MKTNSRKRLLVSSVAMLLVAMLALGTATYAWFTTSSSATANGINVKTSKASELKLSAAQGDWTDTLNYSYSKVLKPASSANGVNWFKADAAGKGAATAKADTIASAGSYAADKQGIEGYVFMQQLNVANMGAADVNDVTISFTLSETGAHVAEGAKYLRLALVPVSGRATASALPSMATTGDDSFAKNVYAVGTDTADAFTDASASSTAKVDAKDASNFSLNIGTLKGTTTANPVADGVKYFNFYIWFEGQDSNCFDTNAGNEMPAFDISVSGDTVATVG